MDITQQFLKLFSLPVATAMFLAAVQMSGGFNVRAAHPVQLAANYPSQGLARN